MTKKYFGTDGIRARVGDEKMNPQFALRLGYAAGRAFKETWDKPGKPTVLIGKDTRISGYLIESALESGFSAAGVDVALLGPVPTPAIAYLTRTFHGCAGVVISASHNPYQDNGIKFFSARGRKLDDALQGKIEHYLNEYENKPLDLVDATDLGKARRIDDAQGRYIEHCKSTVSPRFELSGLNVVLDCANGATYKVAPAVFRELGANVTVIHDKPNGKNINADCGSTHIQPLIKTVLAEKADMGIAFDGDGDRVIMVDEQGNEIDGDAMIYLIARCLADRGKKPVGVVGTVMTNMGTQAAIENLGIDFERAGVGDRLVMEKLVANDWLLGGESSGHIICLKKSTTGDGIVSALQVLEGVINSGKTLSELLKNYHLYPLTMENVAVNDKDTIMQNAELLAEIDKANTTLGDNGRVLIRASGTEEKIRVTVESASQTTVDEYVDYFVKKVKALAV